jgi:hypothetical protein
MSVDERTLGLENDISTLDSLLTLLLELLGRLNGLCRGATRNRFLMGQLARVVKRLLLFRRVKDFSQCHSALETTATLSSTGIGGGSGSRRFIGFLITLRVLLFHQNQTQDE